MMQYSPLIQQLIDAFRRLPGVGNKSAQRMVLHFLERDREGGRKLAEFCENGAKAVAEEATKRVVTREFFARHTVAELQAQPEFWLSQQEIGRASCRERV